MQDLNGHLFHLLPAFRERRVNFGKGIESKMKRTVLITLTLLIALSLNTAAGQAQPQSSTPSSQPQSQTKAQPQQQQRQKPQTQAPVIDRKKLPLAVRPNLSLADVNTEIGV